MQPLNRIRKKIMKELTKRRINCVYSYSLQATPVPVLMLHGCLLMYWQRVSSTDKETGGANSQ